MDMSETTEAILAVSFLVAVLAWGIWRSRKIPGYWSAEAIRQRGREAHRLILFVPSVAYVLLFTWLTFTRGPEAGLSAVFFALVAYLARPNWIRRKSLVNPPDHNQDAATDSTRPPVR